MRGVVPTWTELAGCYGARFMNLHQQRPSRAWRLVITAYLVVSAACSYALHPHQTLDGKPYEWSRAAAIKPGATEAEVLAELGQPLEVLTAEQGTVWRYYERARLWGCRTELLGVIPWGDTPVVSNEAKFRFVHGVVERVDVAPRNR
jgi:hypothetical protein